MQIEAFAPVSGSRFLGKPITLPEKATSLTTRSMSAIGMLRRQSAVRIEPLPWQRLKLSPRTVSRDQTRRLPPAAISGSLLSSCQASPAEGATHSAGKLRRELARTKGAIVPCSSNKAATGLLRFAGPAQPARR